MSHDLYAPPATEVAERRALPATGRIDVGRCLREAWTTCWENFPLWLGVGVVGSLAMVAAVLTVIGAVFVLPVLAWGFLFFFLRMHDGRARFGDLFAGFSCYGEALGRTLGVGLVITLIGLPGQIPYQIGVFTKDGVLMFAGYLLLLAWSCAVTYRLSFAMFLIVDRGLSIGDAVRGAWQMTRGQVGKIVLLTLGMFAVIFAGVLALGVGVIPASVIGYLMWVSAYRQLVGPAAES